MNIWARVNLKHRKGNHKEQKLAVSESRRFQRKVPQLKDLGTPICTGITQLWGQMYHSPTLNHAPETLFVALYFK